MDLWVMRLCFTPTIIFRQVVQTVHSSLPYVTLFSKGDLVNLSFTPSALLESNSKNANNTV